ncbi:MAG: copper chaperone PCu(A)C [Acidimicrobiales bacterium]
MTRTRRRPAPLGLVVGTLVLVATAVGGCSGDEQAGTEPAPAITVTDAVIAVPAGANTAMYLTIENAGGADDRLVAARAPIADRIELHETREGDDGLMQMHRLDHVEVAAGSEVRFEPGGLHVMIFDVVALDEGDVVEVELEFERSATMSVEAVVEPYTDLGDG